MDEALNFCVTTNLLDICLRNELPSIRHYKYNSHHSFGIWRHFCICRFDYNFGQSIWKQIPNELLCFNNCVILCYLPFGAWHITLCARPSWRTLTLARDVLTFGAIFAHAFQRAARTVSSINARMFTFQTNVARLTHILSGHMITRFISVYHIWTSFLATFECFWRKFIEIERKTNLLLDSYLSHSIHQRMVRSNHHHAILCYKYIFQFEHRKTNYYSNGIHFRNYLHSGRPYILFHN